MAPESERNWALIATLRPRLRKHIQISQQCYRGERWYLLRDESSGRFLRFNSAAYQLIGRLDGQRQIADIVSLINAGEEQRRLTSDEVLLLLTQLSTIDALHGSLPADAKKLFERSQRDRRLRLRHTFMNPLSIRIPLLDPDRILERLLPWVNPLFTRAGAIIWLLVVLLAAVLTLTHFHTIGQALDSDVLAPLNLIWLLLVFWIIKTVHEFAHAFAVKRWGGEVHEMGITLLVLAPVPYVNATAAWGFREKYRRVLVSAVGILVELFIAAVALFVWLAVEPGLVKDLARNAMLIGSVSTLLFNA
ncbi:MAG: peptidase M50, partial [Gammaproteobacteria bacterium]|nr:peptidase M50 [Gammaproteobacteria bacterium]